MIRCLPNSLCSWNFTLRGEGHQARVEINWVGEQGSITIDGELLDVKKHGMFSGHWTLELQGEVLASAKKSSVFTRSIEIDCPEDSLLLCAESAFRRSFRVERAGQTLAMIRPDHPFTRRATIETLGQGLDFHLACFAFWLVVLLWRRAKQSD